MFTNKQLISTNGNSINKVYLTLFLLFQSLFCIANSANPFFNGDNSGSAYSSKDVDILHEKITLNLNKQIGKGLYTIVYRIKTDKDGKQIPLLFNAMNYADGFAVWVDNRPVKLIDIPSNSADQLRAVLKDFGDVYLKHDENQNTLSRSQYDLDFSDYKYFEAPLSKGEHTIRVEYFALPGGSKAQWVNRYDYNYSLWPALYWRSFGSLEIVMLTNTANKQIETNLSDPVISTPDSLVWKFDKLPVNVFKISYTSKLTWFANVMINIGPFGFTICFTLIAMLIHIIFIKRVRKRSAHWFSGVTVAGGLIIPVLIFVAFFCSYSMIDAAIGAEATQFHYVGMAIVFYPSVAITYFIIICIIDWLIRLINLKRAAKKAIG